MGKGVYERKKKSDAGVLPVDKSSAETVSPVVEEVPQTILTTTEAEAAQEPPQSLEEAPALLNTGFIVPNHLRFRSIKTKREAPRWYARHLSTKAEVYKGDEFVRVYELEIHGKNFHELADQIVKKHNVLLE